MPRGDWIVYQLVNLRLNNIKMQMIAQPYFECYPHEKLHKHESEFSNSDHSHILSFRCKFEHK